MTSRQPKSRILSVTPDILGAQHIPGAISIAVLIGLLLAPTLLLAQDQAKAEKDLADVLAEKPMALDLDWLNQNLTGLDGKSVDDLQQFEGKLQKIHAEYMKFWNQIQSARRFRMRAGAMVEARTANYVLQMWLAARTLDDVNAAVRDRDREAFYKKYPAGIYGVHAGETSGSKNYEDWLKSPEHAAIWEAAYQANHKFIGRVTELTEKAKSGNSELENKIDGLANEFLRNFTQVTHAISQVNDVIDRKKAGLAATQPEDPRTAPQPLWLWTLSSTYDAVVGQVKEVWIKPIGGEGGYHLLPSGHVARLALDGEIMPVSGYQAIPFIFWSPGVYSVTLDLTDKKGNPAQTKLTFRVASQPKGPTTAAVAEKLIPPPPKPPLPKPAPPGPAWALTPFSGTFRSEFWCPGLIEPPGGTYRDVHAGQAPTPVTITINPDGSVTGRCDYRAPESLFGSVTLARWNRIEWKTQFTMEGAIDWKTGRIELKIPNGVLDSFHEGPIVPPPGKDNGQRYRVERRREYTATLIGWHTADPRWNPQLRDRVNSYSRALGLAPNEHERVGAPNIDFDPAGGVYRFADDGWFGMPGIDKSVSTANVPLKADTTKYVIPPGATIDNLKFNKLNEGLQQMGGGTWYLKLGPPEPTENQLNTLELVATVMWPQDKVVVRPGRTVFAQLMGAFLDQDQVIGPVDLSGRAEWTVTAGLQQTAPGVFVAAKPGEYEISARVKRKDGAWMSGSLEIRVAD